MEQTKLLMKKANKEVRVAQREKERYLAMGFSLISEEGEILVDGKKTNAEYEQECRKLRTHNEKLGNKLAEAIKENETLKATVDGFVSDEAKDEEIAELKKQVFEKGNENQDLFLENCRLKDELVSIRKSIQDNQDNAKTAAGSKNTKTAAKAAEGTPNE